MSRAKTIVEEHENRVAVITAIGIEVRALVLDKSAGEITSADDPDAERLVYAGAFQAWADGKIEGSAEDIFESVEEVLEP
ncbi:MAG: hypothetical protein KGL35_07810 [Bradyrhizobium sp.]|nr:hypothetical protein [Pseudomonadota bacterium]MDE2468634.1 hypothetical protein [Bradyrhizobium sp.]